MKIWKDLLEVAVCGIIGAVFAYMMLEGFMFECYGL